jgi:hypothetical protein
MAKSLDMNCYTVPNGYSAQIINCIDIPIAGAAGYFNYDYYFFYVFYYCLLNNWGDSFLQEFQRISLTLGKLGLAIESHRVEDPDQLIARMQAQLDQNHPVLMPVTYRSIFYSPWTYRDPENRGIHLLLVCGYDSSKEVVVIRDTTHFAATGIDDDLQGLKDFRRTGLFKLQLTEAMIKNIWIDSNEDFARMNSSYTGTFLAVEQRDEPLVKDYGDLLGELPNACSGERSLLALAVRHMEELKLEIRSDLFRNVFNSCIPALFDIVKRALRKAGEPEDSGFSRLENFQRRYMAMRNMITSELSGLSYKNESMPPERKERLIQKIVAMDSALAKLVTVP